MLPDHLLMLPQHLKKALTGNEAVTGCVRKQQGFPNHFEPGDYQ